MRILRGMRWCLADRLRPNEWPSTAAQHRELLDAIRDLSGERDRFRVRAMGAEFVLHSIARGIPFRGQADPPKAARAYLDSVGIE